MLLLATFTRREEPIIKIMRNAYLLASSHRWNPKRNKKDERRIVVRNKARLVAQRHRQKQGIDYDEVFALVVMIEAIKIFLAFLSFMGFIVYQMDVKSAFLYGTIKEELPDQTSCLQFVLVLGFRYLKGQPKLGLWYPRDSLFDLEAYSDSDYAGANLDRKSTTGGCQFLGRRLISWQCKKQTVVATSTTEAEYVAAANCLQQLMLLSLVSDACTDLAMRLMISIGFLLENAEFHQIVDFLSICSINYALTVSPTIYASYIEQFWNTATSKTVNSVKQIHVIVDEKAVVISESLVRSDLLFNDEDGIACLTNAEIFENLTLMGYEQIYTNLTFQKGSFSPQWKFLIHTILHCISSKSTAWNEFSTNLASSVICLAKGQKFNFYKLIFDGMLRNLDSKKFLMYPRFLQLFLNNQLKDLPEPFNDTYETPKHSKKVFSNMARKSISFSGKVTPLFDSMLVQNQAPEGEAHIEKILPSPSTYQRKHRKTHKHRRAKKVTKLPQTSVPLDLGAYEVVHKEGGDSVERATTTDANLVAAQDSDNITKTQSTVMSNDPISQEIGSGDRPRVLALEEVQTTQDKVITRLKLRVRRLEKKRKAKTLQPMKRRLFKGRVETSIDKILGEDASKQGWNDDKTKELNLTDEADTEVIVEDKGSGKKGGSTANQVSTARPEVSAASVPVNVSAATPSTPPTTTTIFGDEDFTIAQTLIKLRNKGKGVLVEEEPEKLEKVKRKDQGLAQIESDANLAQRIYEEELAELDRAQREKQKQEEATIAVLTKEFDQIQARIDVDHELANSGNVDMEDLHVYKIIRANGNISYHKSSSSMLRKFDRQDLVDLHILVMKRFEDNTLEGYNLLLWGDLKSSYIADGWHFKLLQHDSREKVSSHQENAREDVELEARS
uniref:Ribonuclease H-like domain, reverse transcriptase, RNA-dependent DNA polymerase n=1 Tax=Tanacetum cinerariifolium TaxID=118510 RepID=A0A6L2M0Q9_TANCI|nr:ribonuclease H-like domain, reverse transcriptase, RNA-dependent DNA polymerase [Tanacetum cinerariifolium]